MGEEEEEPEREKKEEEEEEEEGVVEGRTDCKEERSSISDVELSHLSWSWCDD